MSKILITRPKYEIATHYLYFWSVILIQEANKKGTLYDLEKKKVNRKNIESYLRKQNPEIVILNGHGSEDCIVGNDDEIIISIENAGLLKDCNVYMRACSAGKILGKEIMKCGAKSFIGYKEPFHFYNKEEFIGKPLDDDYAKPFFDTSNQVGISLIKGKNAKEAQEDSLRIYKKTIAMLLTSKSDNSFLVPDLLWNMSNQVCYISND